VAIVRLCHGEIFRPGRESKARGSYGLVARVCGADAIDEPKVGRAVRLAKSNPVTSLPGVGFVLP